MSTAVANIVREAMARRADAVLLVPDEDGCKVLFCLPGRDTPEEWVGLGGVLADKTMATFLSPIQIVEEFPRGFDFRANRTEDGKVVVTIIKQPKQ